MNNDACEGRADDHGHGEIDHVAAQDEVTKTFQHWRISVYFIVCKGQDEYTHAMFLAANLSGTSGEVGAMGRPEGALGRIPNSGREVTKEVVEGDGGLPVDRS